MGVLETSRGKRYLHKLALRYKRRDTLVPLHHVDKVDRVHAEEVDVTLKICNALVVRLLPNTSHNFISLNNTSNVTICSCKTTPGD